MFTLDCLSPRGILLDDRMADQVDETKIAGRYAENREKDHCFGTRAVDPGNCLGKRGGIRLSETEEVYYILGLPYRNGSSQLRRLPRFRPHDAGKQVTNCKKCSVLEKDISMGMENRSMKQAVCRVKRCGLVSLRKALVLTV